MTQKQWPQEPCLNNFLIILKQAPDGFAELCSKIKEINSEEKKVCYVCLSKPYTEIIEDLKEERVACDKVTFIDAISSQQYPLKPVKNCVFINGMENLEILMASLRRVARKDEYSVILLDSTSSLLVYHQAHEIVRFTHNLLRDEACKTAKKVYLTLKEKGIFRDESAKLINDLNLFADRVIEIGK